MGYSSYGEIFYGIFFDEYELENSFDNAEDLENWEDIYAKIKGFVEIPFPANWNSLSEEEKRPMHECWNKKRELLKSLNVNIIHLSHYDTEYHAIIAADSWKRGEGYNPRVITGSSFVKNCEYDDQIKDFCDKMNIDITGKEPDWYLASSYS